MIRSLYTAISGMRNHQVRMDVTGNNIANVNTTGYKTGRANFSEILSQNIKGASVSHVGVNSYSPSQVGLGIATSSIDNNFAQGGLQATGRVLDLAIVGDGFLMIKDSADSEKTYYSRDGALYLNNEGYLVNSAGLYVLDSSGAQIDLGTDVESIRIDKDGNIYKNSETDPAATIGIRIFVNPEGLAKVGGNLYEVPTGSDMEDYAVTKDDTNGESTVVQSENLEMSNVDLTTEFANMIITQRGYQANARVITTSDQMLQELIDLKR